MLCQAQILPGTRARAYFNIKSLEPIRELRQGRMLFLSPAFLYIEALSLSNSDLFPYPIIRLPRGWKWHLFDGIGRENWSLLGPHFLGPAYLQWMIFVICFLSHSKLSLWRVRLAALGDKFNTGLSEIHRTLFNIILSITEKVFFFYLSDFYAYFSVSS